MKIYVGNLPFRMDDSDLRALFEPFGAVDSASVVTDRDTGRPRGFAFITMADDGEAQAAIDGLDGKELDGRTLKVNQARPRTGGGDRRPRW